MKGLINYFSDIYHSISFIALVALFIYHKYRMSGKAKNQKALEISQKEDVVQEKVQVYSGRNRRKCLRVEVDKIYCMMEFNDFGDSKLKNLTSKKIDGHIEDISLSGIKFVSNYELPVRSDIKITVSFKLDDFVFTISGKIVRRMDHLDNEFVTYGIQFTDLLPSQQKQLNGLINKRQGLNKVL